MDDSAVSNETEGKTVARWPVRKGLVAILLVALLLLQYHLWFGTGGWYDLQKIQQRVAEQEAINAPLRDRNDRLSAEITDLKTGLDAIEERARSDIGMVRADEQFFWVPGVTLDNPVAAGRIEQ